MSTRDTLFQLLIRLADDHLILGHRLSEWCGHAPILEEDLALANMGLDCIGQARALYALAAEREGKGRSEDDLAYLREERAFRNLLLVERPNRDFAQTMLRQLYFAAFMKPWWAAAAQSADADLAAIAARAEKEAAYHLRHAADWTIRLGDGTEESARRMRDAVEELHPYTPELFESDETTEALAAAGLAPDPAALRPEWEATIARVFAEAGLAAPEVRYPLTGGRRGLHTEALGHLLAPMQYLRRAHPGATW
ncbi:MAG: 1,2-phenylacetyl-CoA epoxidase subunit PaaC [Pikeienuella sp.]|uniref:1,2-phenylacetyl-CoA epoxidase subunit PaaC n=1 Tax=Pikeienuella sp. TaxID=2831957 RepID=UPI0039196B94